MIVYSERQKYRTCTVEPSQSMLGNSYEIEIFELCLVPWNYYYPERSLEETQSGPIVRSRCNLDAFLWRFPTAGCTARHCTKNTSSLLSIPNPNRYISGGWTGGHHTCPSSPSVTPAAPQTTAAMVRRLSVFSQWFIVPRKILSLIIKKKIIIALWWILIYLKIVHGCEFSLIQFLPLQFRPRNHNHE